MGEYTYSSIESQQESSDGENATPGSTAMQKGKRWIVSLAVVSVIALIIAFRLGNKTSSPSSVSNTGPSIPMPSGVNFGSWLSLEDYFFASGSSKEVATPFNKTQAACLPPLHTGRWQSETDLLKTLSDEIGLANAVQVFHAHRLSFIDLDADLSQLYQLGIYHVRVPISWCLTDSDPDQGVTDENAVDFVCKDPYYDKVLWPAVPKSLIVRFLRACAKHGIKATLDLHTYPGATSIGTFSGLWPKWPRFWLHDKPETPEKDLGRGLLRDFVKWMEFLAVNETRAFQGLKAISPMNEPAHLAGLFGSNDTKAFLPELPLEMAQHYIEEMAPPSSSSRLTKVPDGPHLRVLMWLRDAVQVFRNSTLPSRGKELQVNIHESIFRQAVLPPSDGDDPGGRHPGATQIIASWWRSATTFEERSNWAVLDMHHYHAWEPSCQGTIDGNGNYTCGDIKATVDALERCASWAYFYRAAINQQCGPGAKLASAEFSASTHHLVRHACNDVTTLRASYLAQIRAAKQAQVKLYYWSYKMTYGGAFRSAWSFKQLMYLLGVTTQPDTPTFDCGEHVELEDEPSDDVFS